MPAGTLIPDPPTRPELADAAHYWSPVSSPSGMVFYPADVFPPWRGSAFVGSLSSHALVRVMLEGDRVLGDERLPLGKRIRDVEQGPDGLLYVLTNEDDGHLWQISPLPTKPASD